MKKSILFLILVILSNLALFIGIAWPLFEIPSGQLPIIGPLYNTFSSDIVDAILNIFIVALMLILNGLLAIVTSVQLKNLINTHFLSRIYFIISVIINTPFLIAVLLRILIAPPAGILNLTYALIVLTFFIIPFFSIVLLFWGLWLWFWLKIRVRPVFIGILLSAATAFIILAFLGVTFYKDLTAPKCNPETGEHCLIINPQ